MKTSFAVQLAMGSMGAASAWVRQRPFILNHLVTVRCNLECPFCYVSGPEQKEYNRQNYPKQAELTTEEVSSFYRQLIDEGFRLAVLVGGEPLLREDLDECLSVVQGKLWVTVFSNGYLLEQRHELIRRANNLFVSLDAPDEQHDRLRAKPGTFRRALAGIEAVRRHHPKVAVTLNMTVTADNVDRVSDMLSFARELGLAIAFQPPSYEGQFALAERPRAASSEKTPQADPVSEAFVRIREAAARGDRIIGSNAFFAHVIGDEKTYPCHYPTYVLGPVLPNGDVQGCVDSKVIGNVRESSVHDVVSSTAFASNAARGPSCPHGCRDWGIYDLSALRERSMQAADFQRYGRMFLRRKQPKLALWLASRTLPTAQPRG